MRVRSTKRGLTSTYGRPILRIRKHGLVAEQAYATGLNPVARKGLWVRFPPRPPCSRGGMVYAVASKSTVYGHTGSTPVGSTKFKDYAEKPH